MKALFVGNELHGTVADVDPEIEKVVCVGVEYTKQGHTDIKGTFYIVMVSGQYDDLTDGRIAKAKELFMSNPVLHTDLSSFTFHTSEN